MVFEFLPAVTLEEMKKTHDVVTRINDSTGKVQIWTTSLLNYLQSTRKQRDARRELL